MRRFAVLPICLRFFQILSALGLPTIAVAQTDVPPNIELPPLLVEGTGERADGPVQGYRATRSATGTRTDAALRDVPQSIVVIPRQVLEDQQATSLDDALRNASGIRPGGSAGGRAEAYLLRGFRTQTYAVDGVLLNPALEFPEAFRDLANIERVEVLKGPTSVLYGRGDPGGLINLVTRQPMFIPSGGVNILAGTYGFARGEFDLTGPIGSSGTLAGRLTGASQQDNGFRDRVHISERQFFAPSFVWQPTDRTRVSVNMSWLDQINPFDRGLVAQGHGVFLPRTRYLGESWSRSSTTRSDFNWRVEHQATDWLTLRQIGHFDWAVAHRLSADLVSLAGTTLSRRATDQDDNSQNIDLQADATARFATGSVRHAVTLGGEYIHAKRSLELSQATLSPIDINNPVYGAQPGRFTLRTVRNNALEMYSAFLQDQIEVGPQFKLLAGVRFDRYSQRDVSNLVASPASGNAVTPRLGLVWQPRTETALFAGWSRSFLPQLGADFSGNAFQPEHGEQYEAGIKQDLIADRLSATLAAFNIRRQNVLVTDPNNPGFSLQTGEQRSRGVELDLAGEFRPGWRALVTGAYTDAEITRDSTFVAGRRLTGVPLWSGSFWTTYEVQQGRLEGLLLGGGVFLVSPRAGDLSNSFRVGGYTRVDATISYPIAPQVRVALTARNLFDANYIEAPVSRTENYPGTPRTILASLKLRF